MKKLNAKSFDEIRHWIHRNARQVELALWEYDFENGSGDNVISALSHYQNVDGGFGNALEPDCWNPGSSPYTTLCATSMLKDIGFAGPEHPMIRGILKFFESGIYVREDGWPFSIPSNNHYPRAPWWTYDEQANEYESIGVSLGIACFLLRFAGEKSALYSQALSVADRLIKKLGEPGKLGDMGLTGYCMLLETIESLALGGRFDTDSLSSAIKERVDKAIVRDVSEWANYGVRPSQFIQSPDSRYYPGNEEIVQKELDYLIETRPENDVWGITWRWFGFEEKYAREFAISENWWKASWAIGKLKFLRSFGRARN